MANEQRITAGDLQRERTRYLNSEITHDEYYCWLADSVGITDAHLPVSLDRIRESKDPHLNDIPLHLWDQQHAWVWPRWLPWSLSDSVCCLKAVARRAAGKGPVPK